MTLMLSRGEVERLLPPGPCIEAVEDVMPHEHELYVEGASSMLTKPEFADAESMRKSRLPTAS